MPGVRKSWRWGAAQGPAAVVQAQGAGRTYQRGVGKEGMSKEEPEASLDPGSGSGLR